ncbi:MAG: hypothetical protein M0R77_17540 [Gammaproteobacteria bacterium]|nr:hypothetical protein [Gammaproteobacteria bacterium]
MLKNWYIQKVKKPGAETLDGWENWTEKTKNEHPALYFLFETLPRFFSVKKRRIWDLKYHLKQKYFHGYHNLRLDVKRFKAPYNKERLHKYSWMDADSQMELFMFQILVNFIEKEVGYNQFVEIAYDDEKNNTSDRYKELLELYHWFIDDYCDQSFSDLLHKELYDQFPDFKSLRKTSLFSKPKTQRERDYHQANAIMMSKISDRDEILEEQMGNNLIKLIKLRGCMWT